MPSYHRTMNALVRSPGGREGGERCWDRGSRFPAPLLSPLSLSFNVGHLRSPELGPSAATISLASTAGLISPALGGASECGGSPAGLLLIRCTFWFVLSLIAFSVTYNGWPPGDLHIAWLTDLFIYRLLPGFSSPSLPSSPSHHLVPLKSQSNRSREGSSTIKYICHPPSLQDKSLSVLLSNSRQLD